MGSAGEQPELMTFLRTLMANLGTRYLF